MVQNLYDEIEILPNASDVPEGRRGELLNTIGQIIRTNWEMTTPHWSSSHSPFQDDHGMVLMRTKGEIFAYTIYQRLRASGQLAIYRSSSAVRSDLHGKGAYKILTQEVLKVEFAAPRTDHVYYAWRTRSPVVWLANARICDAVTPSIAAAKTDSTLSDICLDLAGQIYPGIPIEVPQMVMRGVYGHLTYYREPRHQTASEVNRWFNEVIPNTADSVFSVGRVVRTR